MGGCCTLFNNSEKEINININSFYNKLNKNEKSKTNSRAENLDIKNNYKQRDVRNKKTILITPSSETYRSNINKDDNYNKLNIVNNGETINNKVNKVHK